MSNEYAVSIRRSYIMPDHTFDGYEFQACSSSSHWE